MKIIGTIALLMFSTSAFADISCAVPNGWSIQFNSGSQVKFKEAYQVLKNGDKSEVDTVLLQAYESPGEFKARIELDGQSVNIRTNLSHRVGEYAVYTGTLTLNKIDTTVTCSQN